VVTLRDAAQFALDYIRSTADYKMGHPPACEAAVDLADALAEPQQEPVAWGMPRSDGAIIDCISPEEHANLEGDYTVPLYTAPQPKAEPQEPVLVVEKEPSYWTRGHFCEGEKSWIDPIKVWSLPIGTKLYSKPQPRREVTLSDEEIGTLANEHLDVGDGLCGRNFVIGEIEFARAVIAAYRAKQGETK
jgi:hypothetical protein